MITLTPENIAVLSLTPRLIAQEAFKRKWIIELPYLETSLMLITKSDGKQLSIFSSTPPTTSFTSHYIAQDKFIAHQILTRHGFTTLETYLSNFMEEGIAQARKITISKRCVVVKPLDKAHGTGITVNISTDKSIRKALEVAFSFSKKAIIQEYVEDAIDIRITAINYKVVAALQRVPASVVGDGKHSIKQLIEIDNSAGHRGKNYSKSLNMINIRAAKRFLGDKIENVPCKNEKIVVVGTANMGSGGETHDITDHLPSWLIKEVETCAKVLDMPVIAVDYLLKETLDVGSVQKDTKKYLVEVNKCPALFMHEMPSVGRARPVIKSYLDYLESL